MNGRDWQGGRFQGGLKPTVIAAAAAAATAGTAVKLLVLIGPEDCVALKGCFTCALASLIRKREDRVLTVKPSLEMFDAALHSISYSTTSCYCE